MIDHLVRNMYLQVTKKSFLFVLLHYFAYEDFPSILWCSSLASPSPIKLRAVLAWLMMFRSRCFLNIYIAYWDFFSSFVMFLCIYQLSNVFETIFWIYDDENSFDFLTWWQESKIWIHFRDGSRSVAKFVEKSCTRLTLRQCFHVFVNFDS